MENFENMFWQKPENEKEYIWRFGGNPLFDIEKSNFWHICNSAVTVKDNKYVGVFRVEEKTGRPMLVYGESADGINWNLEKQEIDLIKEDGTKLVTIREYCYDPRITKIGNDYYVVFCADIEGPSIYIAKTQDFHTYKVLPMGFLPFNRNGVLFPEKINGNYCMLSRPSDSGNTPFGHIYLSESKDLIYWGKHRLVSKNFDAGYNFWERIKIGAGPAPIKTEEGWLLIYHGVQATCNCWTYSMGVMLLDLNNPAKVLYKAKRYLLTPEKIYERVGFTNNVCFPCAALCDLKGHITIYYGVADTNIAVAFTTVSKLLEFVKKYN
jgi:beta-1,4-mannooligosaccharide/beta-1,4-mannosyl-N-acetylglucosamine phosphorylase